MRVAGNIRVRVAFDRSAAPHLPGFSAPPVPSRPFWGNPAALGACQGGARIRDRSYVDRVELHAGRVALELAEPDERGVRRSCVRPFVRFTSLSNRAQNTPPTGRRCNQRGPILCIFVHGEVLRELRRRGLVATDRREPRRYFSLPLGEAWKVENTRVCGGCWRGGGGAICPGNAARRFENRQEQEGLPG